MDAFWTSPLLLIFPGRMIGESMGRHGSWIGAKRRARARPHLQCRTGDSCAAVPLLSLPSPASPFPFPRCRCGCDRIRSYRIHLLLRSQPSTEGSRNICTARRGRRPSSSFSLQVQGIKDQDRRCAIRGLLGPSAATLFVCLPMASCSKPATQVTAVCFFHTFQR